MQYRVTVTILSFILLSPILMAASHTELSDLEKQILAESTAQEPVAESTAPLDVPSVPPEAAKKKPEVTQVCDESQRDDQRFAVCGDGDSVLDEQTGLMWSRCAIGQQWNAVEKTCEGQAETMNWQEALQRIQNDNQQTDALTKDWRLPNIKELSSITATYCHTPAIDMSVFPGATHGDYWSASVFEQFPGRAWFVNFLYGSDYASDKRYFKHVRKVRLGKHSASYNRQSGTESAWENSCITYPLIRFSAAENVPLLTEIRSETIAINFKGLPQKRRIEVLDGEYQLNGDGIWRSIEDTVKSGDTVMLRHISSNAYLDQKQTILKVGDRQGIFTSTTEKLETPAYEEVMLSAEILFAYKSATLSDQARQSIDNYMAQFESKINQIESIRVTGHTDAIASQRYNLKLSEQRATAVKEYITQIPFISGIPVQAEGKGKLEPVATNDTEQGRAQNRRVVLRINYKP